MFQTARTQGGSTVYYDLFGETQSLVLRVKPRITCHSFPRPHRNLTLNCGEKNITTNTVTVPYKFQSSTKETATILMCLKGEEGSLSVAHSSESACCDGNNTLSCICSEGRCDTGRLVLELNRTYILYFQIEPPNVTCKVSFTYYFIDPFDLFISKILTCDILASRIKEFGAVCSTHDRFVTDLL